MAEAKKKSLVVVAPIVTARMENSRLTYLYRGDVVPDGLTADSLKHLSDLGFIAEPQPEK